MAEIEPEQLAAQWRGLAERLGITPDDIGGGQPGIVLVVVAERLLDRIEALEAVVD